MKKMQVYAVYKNKIYRVMAIDFYGNKVVLAKTDVEFPESLIVPISKIKLMQYF